MRTVVAGVAVSSIITRLDELETAFQNTMAPGRAGTLSTRTDDNTGIVTVASGHGITDADKVSVFWNGGYRYNVTVTATTSTTISIDLGAGANLPIATTVVVVGKEVEHALAIDGDQLVVLAIGCENRASIHFRDGSDASLLPYDLQASEGRLWVAGMGFTNPLASDTVANIVIANGGVTAKPLVIGLLSTTD